MARKTSPIDSIVEFVEVVRKSGLMKRTLLERLLREFKEEFVPECETGDSITSLTKFFVKTGILTCWQCDKLRRGQYKGFRLGGFLLMDRLKTGEKSNEYLAREETTWKIVRLEVDHNRDHLQQPVQFRVKGSKTPQASETPSDDGPSEE